MDELSIAILKVKREYLRLGLKVPFNNQLLHEMKTIGTDMIRWRLKTMIREDFRGDDLMIEITLANVDSYLQPLNEAVGHMMEILRSQEATKQTTFSDYFKQQLQAG